MIDPALPIAVYMEGAVRGYGGKMGFGVLRYSQNPIACVIDSETAGGSISEVTRIERDGPVVATLHEAHALGARVFLLGIAPPGGLIPPTWWPVIDRAVALGMTLVNGLHDQVAPRYPQAAPGSIWDIRIEPEGLKPGTGACARLTNRRILLIGTDMAVGKMTAGLEMMREMRQRGQAVEFVATGQIGITITGRGVPLDAVRVDYASGAIEREVLAASADGATVIVEGQGSLIHPGSTANLPLLRGSCPTHLVLCHRAGQTHLQSAEDFKIPSLPEFLHLYQDLASACGTFPRPMPVAVALNTSHLDPDEANAACRAIEDELNLPCADPIRHGAGALLIED